MKAQLAALGVVVTLALSGCGGSETADDRVEVVYVPGLVGNPFYNTVACGAKTQAKADGVDFSVQGAPEFDVAKQSAIVNALVGSRPDAIMISVTDVRAMKAPLLLAKQAGITIIGIDGDLQDESIMTSTIISNNVEGGRLAGEKMVELTGGKGEVMALGNDPGNPISLARTQGFAEVITKHPGMRYLGAHYTKNETAKAASITSSAASSNRKLAGVYTTATNNTEGAVTGLREAGKTNTVKLIGFDVSEPIQTAIQAGAIDGLVVQFPFGEGQEGLKTAVAAVERKPVERHQTSPFVFATPDNFASPKVQKYLYTLECSA